jgi:hypothetical protein
MNHVVNRGGGFFGFSKASVTVTITAAAFATPIVVTSAAHGFSAGDVIQVA